MRSAAIGAAVLTAVHALALAMLWLVPADHLWIVTLALAIGGVVAILLLMGSMDIVPSIVLMVLVVGAVFAYGWSGAAIVGQLRGTSLANLDLRGPAPLQEAAALRFRDARVLDLEGHAQVTYTRKGSTMTHEYRVVPIVDSAWTREQPVTAWAGCETSRPEVLRACRADWAQPWKAGLQVHADQDRSGFRAAVRDATRRHGLVTTADPLLVFWTADPEARARQEAGAMVIGIAASYAAWLAVALFFAWRSKRAAERFGGAPQPPPAQVPSVPARGRASTRPRTKKARRRKSS